MRICIILFLFSGHLIKWASHIWLLIYLWEVLDITVWHQEALMKQTALCALQCVIGALYLLLGHPRMPCVMFSWYQMHVTTIVSGLICVPPWPMSSSVVWWPRQLLTALLHMNESHFLLNTHLKYFPNLFHKYDFQSMVLFSQ